MALKSSSLTVQQLLTAWQSQQHITSTQTMPIKDFLAQHYAPLDLPLYIRVFSAVGAFIATGCLIIFLGISGLIDFSKPLFMLGVGMLFLLAAVLLYTKSGAIATVRHVFLLQLSLCMIATGKVLEC